MRDAVRNEKRWQRRHTPTQDPSTNWLANLQALPPTLARELLGYLYKGQVMDVPLFRGLPSQARMLNTGGP